MTPGGRNLPEPDDPMLMAARQTSRRRAIWRKEGEPSVVRFVGQIGVLGWIIVLPILVGLFVGRWLDHKFGTGIFWSGPLLVLGVAIGGYSAWKWMHRQ